MNSKSLSPNITATLPGQRNPSNLSSLSSISFSITGSTLLCIDKINRFLISLFIISSNKTQVDGIVVSKPIPKNTKFLFFSSLAISMASTDEYTTLISPPKALALSRDIKGLVPGTLNISP